MRLLICTLALACGAALAQDKPAAKEPAKPAAAQPSAEKAADKPAALAKKSRRAEDARHCLEKASNTEVIKCAEAYL
jgi:hypothetical protein